MQGRRKERQRGSICLPLFGKIKFPVAQVIGSGHECVYGGRGGEVGGIGWQLVVIAVYFHIRELCNQEPHTSPELIQMLAVQRTCLVRLSQLEKLQHRTITQLLSKHAFLPLCTFLLPISSLREEGKMTEQTLPLSFLLQCPELQGREEWWGQRHRAFKQD